MGYQDLIVYQKTKALTIKVIKLFEMLPKNRTIDIIQNQLVRSVCSVGANIAEGYGRNNPREYRQYLSISRGSCFETEHWLEVLRELTPPSTKIHISKLVEENVEILKMLTTTIKNLSAST